MGPHHLFIIIDECKKILVKMPKKAMTATTLIYIILIMLVFFFVMSIVFKILVGFKSP